MPFSERQDILAAVDDNALTRTAWTIPLDDRR
jgi:hypothetical protein